MKTLLAAGALVALAAPAFAEEEAAATTRLSELETMVITSIKEAPAVTTDRLRDFETMTITAPKEQPKEHEVDSKTAALLATLEKE